MKRLLIIFIISTSAIFADDKENCDPILPLGGQSIMELAETKCLGENLSRANINRTLTKEKTTKKFCNTCKNHLMSLSMDDRIQPYAKATMNELQKELTFISVDLIKMRSSFVMDFDSDVAVKSCNFNKLTTPTCLQGKELENFKSETVKIQNTMATELASLLSEKPILDEGLLKRTNYNSCNIKDNEILFAEMRYNESLLTPEIINSLRQLNLKKDLTLKQSIDEKINTNVDLFNITEKLSAHPILKELFNEPMKLKNFLANIDSSDDNKKIIEKLYKSETANEMGNKISDRCKEAFQTTARILEKVYCDKKSPYVATNAASMELLNGKDFEKLSDHEAEESIQRHCARLNSDSQNAEISPTKFDEVLQINSKNNTLLASLPVENFKTTAYLSLMGNQANVTCKAIQDKSLCKKDPAREECQMAKFLEQSHKDKHYKELANSSNSNINAILRSLLDQGLPQKDGKVDQAAVTLLQTAGILSGGNPQSQNPAPRDAGSFFKTVSNETNGTTPSPIPQSQTKTTQAPAPHFSPTSNATAAVNETEKDDSTDSSKSTVPSTPAGTKQATNKFSNLSDSEQQDLLDRLKPKAKNKVAKTQGMNSASNQSEDSSFANGPTNGFKATTSINQEDSLSNNAAQAPSVQNKFPASSGTQAKLDSKVVRKDASLNEAKLSALQNRGPASDPVKDTTIALSKTESGLNKIEIKVPDESILDKKTPDLEAKIQDYLDKSASSLTGAKKGEAFIVKLGKYDIKVAINDYGVYVASCKDTSLHPEYLAFLSRYFTGYKERVSTRLSMENIISKEQKKAN
jgi:hypothetical protein